MDCRKYEKCIHTSLDTARLSYTGLPPTLTVRYKDLVSFLDNITATPHAHSQLASFCSPLFEHGIWLRLDTSIIIDEPRFIPHQLCINADAQARCIAVEGKVVVRSEPVVAVNLTGVINDMASWLNLLCRKKPKLSVGWMRLLGDPSDDGQFMWILDNR